LIELQQVVDLLPMISVQAPTPKGMRERVLGTVLKKGSPEQAESLLQSEAVPVLPSRAASHSRKPDHSGKAAEDEEINIAELSRRAIQTEKFVRRTVYWRWGGAVLAAAVVGMGLYAFQLKADVRKLQEELAAEGARLTAAGSELAKAREELKALSKPAEALKVTKVVNLLPAVEASASKGLATIAVDTKGSHILVQAEELPIIGNSEAFQVWLIKDNQPVNAGTFYPQDGKGGIYYTFEAKEYDSVAITLEPDAKGEKPRGNIVLTAGLKS
jgi:hypothetical protein